MNVVLPDSKTIYNGWMCSSLVTSCDFENYIARDVFACIDGHYRTISGRASHRLGGQSMGGSGGSRIGMKHPDDFGSLYIMSSSSLSPMGDGGPGPEDQIKKMAIAVEQEIVDSRSPADLAAQSPSFSVAQYKTAAAWALDPKNATLYLDLPTKDGLPVPEIHAKFVANAPLVFVHQYIVNLKRYRAVARDVGDQDGLRIDAGKLRGTFDRYGIAIRFEIDPGTHKRCC